MNLKPLYDEIYEDIDYGPILTARGLSYAILLSQSIDNDKKIVCIGSGNAYEAVWLKINGYDVTTLDYIAPDIEFLKGHQVVGECQRMPFKDDEFDYVMCCEMLEHIYPKDIPVCLKELYRIGKNYIFSIADMKDPYKYDSHVCVKPFEWWFKKLTEIGFNIWNAQHRPTLMITTEIEGVLNANAVRWANGYLFRASKH